MQARSQISKRKSTLENIKIFISDNEKLSIKINNIIFLIIAIKVRKICDLILSENNKRLQVCFDRKTEHGLVTRIKLYK